MAIPSFVDHARLHVIAGKGGDGCSSVKREKFKPLGGPDGGNGGHGGSIIVRVDPGLTTLVDYHRQSRRQAPNGQPGMGDHRNGAHGDDIVLMVPPGTVVIDQESGQTIADLAQCHEAVVAQGGRGGLGNAALANAARKAPGFALLGEPGEEKDLLFELKVMADIGLVGFPSAGKSSLIAAISAAKPKIADYPFTTLVPNLGVVVADETTFTVADVPGLIEGASQGKGLGHDFLRHIERCLSIVHVIDTATWEVERQPLRDLEIIEDELKAYGGLEDRPRLIALNKIDIPDGKEMVDLVIEDIQAKGYPVFPISTKTGEGLKPLIFAMADLVKKYRASHQEADVVEVITPLAKIVDDEEFTIAKMGDSCGGFVWRVRGSKPDRWVRQTDFGNAEAVGYLSDRLAKLGVEQRLLEMGAEEGDAVAIGAGQDPVIFDFAPQIESGAQYLGHRGEDPRLEQIRPSVARRREMDAEYHAARDQLMGKDRTVNWRDEHRKALLAELADDAKDWDDE